MRAILIAFWRPIAGAVAGLIALASVYLKGRADARQRADIKRLERDIERARVRIEEADRVRDLSDAARRDELRRQAGLPPRKQP
jgi:hypothetical protein